VIPDKFIPDIDSIKNPFESYVIIPKPVKVAVEIGFLNELIVIFIVDVESVPLDNV